jgi:tRNA(adenine34) deaminase
VSRRVSRVLERAADSTDRHWMTLALAAARRAAGRGEVPVGAVLVDDGGLLASGTNRTVVGLDPTLHAEIVALRRAARRRGNYRLPGTRLYVTLEPCPMCLGALLWARVEELVYALPDPKAGAVESVARLAELPFPHRLKVRRGPGGEESAALLRAFFAPRRRREGGRP